MTRVVATGTFDILHPGHVLYLCRARQLGDELWVIVSRESTIKHKRKPLIPEQQRLYMVQSLKCVDHAILGSETDMFEPIVRIKPDIIVLGFNQHWDEERAEAKAGRPGYPRAESCDCPTPIRRSTPPAGTSGRRSRKAILR